VNLSYTEMSQEEKNLSLKKIVAVAEEAGQVHAPENIKK